VEQWLTYAPPESLSLYNFQKPRVAKKLYFDVIPRAVDEYVQFLDAFRREEPAKQLENPVWHIHNGQPPQYGSPISFALLLNLVSAANAETKDVLWGFIKRYAPEATPADQPLLDQLAGFAVAYYRDFIQPTKKFRAPTEAELAAILDLKARLEAMGPDMRDGDEIQNMVFDVGKTHQFENLRDWFKALYEVLLGQEQGPRFGGFVALFGVPETIALIEERLAAWS
jgi:lysyl-tRNA synthetase class 1